MNTINHLLSIILLVGLTLAGPLNQVVWNEIQVDQMQGCIPKQQSCFTVQPAMGPYTDYTTVDVKLVEVTKEGVSCCYKYTSTHNYGNKDCTEKNPALSHWTLSHVCNDDKVLSSSTTVDGGGNEGAFGGDPNTCMNGLKFERGCEENESPCTYKVCIKWSNFEGTCCTSESWYNVKAGKTSAFGSLQVPTCHCPNDGNGGGGGETCDESQGGELCTSDAECNPTAGSDCMTCCKGTGKCHNRNELPALAEQALMSIKDINDNHVLPVDNNKGYYNILAGGVVLFILVNNIFICYWCVCKNGWNKMGYVNVNKQFNNDQV
eukprot:923734_1